MTQARAIGLPDVLAHQPGAHVDSPAIVNPCGDSLTIGAVPDVIWEDGLADANESADDTSRAQLLTSLGTLPSNC